MGGGTINLYSPLPNALNILGGIKNSQTANGITFVD